MWLNDFFERSPRIRRRFWHAIVYGAGSLLLWPSWGYAAPCPKFTWHHPPEMVQPEILVQATRAMEEHDEQKARRLLSSYLQQSSEGVFAEGARYALALLPQEGDDRENGFLMSIDRLERVRERYPESPYAAWALCWEGELYRQAGWSVEANAMFQQLLETYPQSPIVGGALLGAGLTYLENRQYLEAALVFRRIVEEPEWAEYHVEGALGLADATALSGAWQPAHYWYRVVEAEAPRLLRASVRSTYFAALAEWHVGDRWKAASMFLVPINLYPRREEAGNALNRIGTHLLAEGHEFLALWFFNEAAVRFERQEPGRRGQAALTRWVVTFLSRSPSEEERARIYDRLDQLELYVPLSWDGVLETALNLRKAPEPDLADEARFWLARGHEELDDEEAALAAYGELASAFHDPRWGAAALKQLKRLLVERVRAYHRRHAWVELIQFHHAQRARFLLLPPDRDLMLMIAEAYREVHLPEEALAWYDEVLKHYPHNVMMEDIMAQQMLLAMKLPGADRAVNYAMAYREAFPRGRWGGEAAWILGLHAFQDHRISKAIEYFTIAIQHARDQKVRMRALRYRADAYRLIGRLDSAIRDFRALMNSSNTSVDDEVALADLLFEQQAYPDAARIYETVLKRNASSDTALWARFRLGLCYHELGERSRAEQLLEHVLREEIDDPELERIIHQTARSTLNLLRVADRKAMVSQP